MGDDLDKDVYVGVKFFGFVVAVLYLAVAGVQLREGVRGMAALALIIGIVLCVAMVVLMFRYFRRGMGVVRAFGALCLFGGGVLYWSVGLVLLGTGSLLGLILIGLGTGLMLMGSLGMKGLAAECARAHSLAVGSDGKDVTSQPIVRPKLEGQYRSGRGYHPVARAVIMATAVIIFLVASPEIPEYEWHGIPGRFIVLGGLGFASVVALLNILEASQQRRDRPPDMATKVCAMKGFKWRWLDVAVFASIVGLLSTVGYWSMGDQLDRWALKVTEVGLAIAWFGLLVELGRRHFWGPRFVGYYPEELQCSRCGQESSQLEHRCTKCGARF